MSELILQDAKTEFIENKFLTDLDETEIDEGDLHSQYLEDMHYIQTYFPSFEVF